MRPLPIDPYVGSILDAVEANQLTVVVAPPGCGKTTRVPAGLLGDGRWAKSVVLEPRRVAARSAASRIARELEVEVGEQVGYSVRGDRRASKRTRLEIVTDGLFVRRLQSDPELSGVDVVVVDEFHERRMASDLAIALCLDVASGLRPDLRIVLMSATPDIDAVLTAVPSAHVIEVASPAHPVEVEYRPAPASEQLEDSIDRVIREVEPHTQGDILVFVPGRREIDRCIERSRRWGRKTLGLHGSLGPEEQASIIGGGPQPRIVVSTNLAESSVTVDGVTLVVDSGLRRAPIRELSGLAPLRTVRASRSSADQRAGRAGRQQPGRVIRLWDRNVEESLDDTDPPEIVTSELDDLALQLAIWGVDAGELAWLTPPDPAALDEARLSLRELAMLDSELRPTDLGRKAGSLGVGPRLAGVAIRVAETGDATTAACLATLIESGASGDLAERLETDTSSPSREARRLEKRLRQLPNGSSKQARGPAAEDTIGAAVGRAFAHLLARRRPDGRYLLACGRGATSDDFSDDWLAVTSVSGSGADVRIDAALAIDKATALAASPPTETTELAWNGDQRRATLEVVESIGAIVLSRRSRVPTAEESLVALGGFVAENGLLALDHDATIAQVVSRWTVIAGLSNELEPPDIDRLESDLSWLGPYLKPERPISAATIADAMLTAVSWDAQRVLDELAPTELETPLGNRRKVDWSTGTPVLSAPVQEFFGAVEHPTVARGRLRVTLELLSPAMRPVQRTEDIDRFWKGTYADVRKELRGRYPKHHWPEDPASAKPWKPGLPKT